jgi:PAS domain S-box-containing protein
MNALSQPETQPAARPESAHRVLVVDDDSGIRTFCQLVLKGTGFACDVFAEGVPALAAARSTRYDVVLLDIEMPRLTGPQILHELRRESPDPYLKILFMSGLTNPDMMAHLLADGADDYLEKPFSPVQLRERIEAALRLKESQERTEALNRDLEQRVAERTAELVRANEVLHREITDRKVAEEDARLAHEENEQLLASISSILIGIDDDGRITRWNQVAEGAFGIPAAEAVGTLFRETPIRWQDPGTVNQILDARVRGEQTRFENIPFQRCAGTPRFLGLTVSPILATSGSRQGTLLLGADVTGRRLLEAQLAQAQKMESIGQLAAGIAHEINTPIQYIGDNLSFLAEAFADLKRILDTWRGLQQTANAETALADSDGAVDAARLAADLEYLAEEIPRAIQQSLEGVAHIAKIVRAMKEFSHPGTNEKTPVDINHALQNTVTIARNEWKYVAEVESELAPDLPLVPCLPDELNQVFLNLLVNAAHAVAEVTQHDPDRKGTITVGTRVLGCQVEIWIRDTGCGIPEAIRGKIFDPFFTTKPVGKGTGQGLAIAHAVVVQKHGGTLTVESEVGRGTTFFVRLPLNLEPSGATTAKGAHGC